MRTLNAFDRQLLTDVLLRGGIAAVLSELAWLQIASDLTEPRVEPVRTDKSDIR
jgi:hypothetical protein